MYQAFRKLRQLYAASYDLSILIDLVRSGDRPTGLILRCALKRKTPGCKEETRSASDATDACLAVGAQLEIEHRRSFSVSEVLRNRSSLATAEIARTEPRDVSHNRSQVVANESVVEYPEILGRCEII
jgi:hypothetical protein